ncbi:Hypothetical protein D9617_5g069800 [Elsinoe fawcettii]|nr:Hypothetical protein D9617_5g069800 [Elsinoe fawcettii]
MLVECPAFEIFRNEALTGYIRRRSLAGPFDSSFGCFNTANACALWPPNLDGSDEPQIATKASRRASAGAADRPTTTEQALTPAAASTRPRGQMSVADRIKAINNSPRHKVDTPRVRKDEVTTPDGNVPHRTSTNLSKRMSPFVRRIADGSPQVEQPPIVHSKPPLKPTTIHTPIPQRHASVLLRAPDTPRPSEVSRSERGPSRSRADFIRRGPLAPKSDPVLPSEVLPTPAYLSCSRHGRKLGIRKRRGPTLEGMERSRSGAYIPSGHRIRHQIPTTSPYYYIEKTLTKTEGTSLSPEPCPDCVAEETIRRQEDNERAQSQPLLSSSPMGSPSNIDISSVATEPGTPVEEALTGPSLIGTSIDHQAVLLPGSAVPSIIEADMSSVVSADLGDMIDAIIIEHRGTLNRVITNLRNSAPTMDSFQQISRDLARVSTSMSTMKPEKADILDKERVRYSVILDSPPEFLTSRTKSIPDLIDYIDSAAKDLGVALPNEEKVKIEQSTAEQSDMPTPTMNLLVGSPHETARPLDQAAKTLRDRAANKSLAPPQGIAPAQAPSAYTTANSSRSGSPVTQLARSSSPLVLAVNIPAAMPKAMPVPMIGPTGTMNMDFTSPSEMRGNTSFVSVPGNFGRGSQPAPMSNTQFTSGSGGEMRTDGSWDTKTARTKIPVPAPLSSCSTSPRRWSVLPGSIKMAEMPHSNTKDTSRKDPLRPLKPSEVKDMSKKPGTFAQPFARELARGASIKERNERRSRLGKKTLRSPA